MAPSRHRLRGRRRVRAVAGARPSRAHPVPDLAGPGLADRRSTAPGRHGLRRLRPAAAVGWWFGFGYFLAGLWWVGAAFLVDVAAFGWMMPFAVILLPAGLALFTAAGVALARLLWVDRPQRIAALTIGLTTAEVARGHLLTGFPWNLARPVGRLQRCDRANWRRLSASMA